jgi:sulfite exporter TauE/SafE
MNELWLTVVIGLTLGFAGSFHCLGMCGPLALAIPVGNAQRGRTHIPITLYNLGRAFSYAMIGMVAGFVGSGFKWWGWQQGLSVMAGIWMLLFLFYRFKLPFRIPWLQAFHQKVQSVLSKKVQPGSISRSALMIGLLNGWLPCGLVYVALPAALVTAHPWQGSLLMFSFGIGTWPVMMGLMWAGHRLSIPIRQKMYRFVPYLTSVLAIVLILRGLNLGIPYVSPKLDDRKPQVEMCHRPRD